MKQEPEAKLQLQVQAPPVGGDIKPANLLQSQPIPGGLQQVVNTLTHCTFSCSDVITLGLPRLKTFLLILMAHLKQLINIRGLVMMIMVVFVNV